MTCPFSRVTGKSASSSEQKESMGLSVPEVRMRVRILQPVREDSEKPARDQMDFCVHREKLKGLDIRVSRISIRVSRILEILVLYLNSYLIIYLSTYVYKAR